MRSFTGLVSTVARSFRQCRIYQRQENCGGVVEIQKSFVGPQAIRRYHSADPKPGLFSIQGLEKPSDFLLLAQRAMTECDSLRQSLSQEKTPIDSVHHASEVLFMLDSISKKVCDVIDAAELCRCVHTSEQWRESANDVFALLSDYISQLNSDVSLYEALAKVADSPVFPDLNEEQQRFATLLKAEFERDGIHLPDSERENLRQLHSTVTALETMFQENIGRSKNYFDVEADLVEDIIPAHIIEAHVPQSQDREDGMITLSTDAHIANTLGRYSSNPLLRKQIYMETNTSCAENLEVLEALRQYRHQAAVAQGFESYAARFLRDKMAGDQSTVLRFLENLQRRINEPFRREMELISSAKRKVEGDAEVKPWDIPFYTTVLKASNGFDAASVSAYLTIDNCLEAMKHLVKELFGVAMRESPMSDTERWDQDPSVHPAARARKFEFLHESGLELGCMYLDLHPREGKYGHAAHFTVRCGCSLGVDSHDYQLPIVALVCNMSPPEGNNIPCLTHSEVETLFHEFGHGLHSLLSRTTFQHMSGTRAPMDFVETPSHLIENFVWDHNFLKVLGKHYQTGGVISDDILRSLARSRKDFRGIEIQNQIVYSKFDQALFGPPDTSATSTTAMFAHLVKSHGIPYEDGTHWHSRFGHLVTYGAGYYGYLYSQVFSIDIWNEIFEDKPIARDAGDRLWKDLLVHGGAKDPNEMLRTLLRREPLVDAFFERLDL